MSQAIALAMILAGSGSCSVSGFGMSSGFFHIGFVWGGTSQIHHGGVHMSGGFFSFHQVLLQIEHFPDASDEFVLMVAFLPFT